MVYEEGYQYPAAVKQFLLCFFLLCVLLLAELMFIRFSLILFSLPALIAASIIARRTGRYRRTLTVVSIIIITLGAIPIDFGFRQTGHLGLRILRAVPGLPTADAIEDDKQGKVYLTGCIQSPDTTRYVAVFSF